MGKRTFVIVGASLAGASAAAQLREDGFDGRILLVGEEPVPPYERPSLSKEYLRGDGTRAALDAQAASFYARNAIELRTSTRATAVDPGTQEVVLDDGHRLRYDRLLLTTGSAPRHLNVPGSDLDGIHYLRTVENADALRAAVARASRVVVVGGGWIGAEVAASIRQLGLPVSMVAIEKVPLQRVLGEAVGSLFGRLHAGHGVELAMNHVVRAFRGTSAVEAVETDDGSRIEGDLVVVGIGATPRTRLAKDAGLDVGDGILVDEHLETSASGIFAAGDVAGAWHPLLASRVRVEHWDNAKRQGRAAARNMLGMQEPYRRIPYFYSDQYDLSMEYAGYAPTFDRVAFRGDPASDAFVAFWLEDGRVVAGMNANVPNVNESIAALVASRERVAVERLIDPDVALGDLGSLTLSADFTAPSLEPDAANASPVTAHV
ncbi:MAG TPA: FAD-dependent oxidoreductase [Candidatus Limnocylindrales bacterium]|nr:FAD-dependent oxidoreductase [Candidatus Limnocylindrales bacterium]